MPGVGSSVGGRQGSNTDAEQAWLDAILQHSPVLQLERPSHLKAVTAALAASEAKPSWLPHVHEAVQVCDTVITPALPAGMPGVVARNLYIMAFSRILASQTEPAPVPTMPVAGGPSQQLLNEYYQQQTQQLQPQLQALPAQHIVGAMTQPAVKVQPQTASKPMSAQQAASRLAAGKAQDSGNAPQPPSAPQHGTPLHPTTASQAAFTSRQPDVLVSAQDPSQPMTAAHYQARLHSMLLSGTSGASPRSQLDSRAQPLEIRPTLDLGSLPSGAGHPTVQLRPPHPSLLSSSQADLEPPSQQAQQQQQQVLKAEAGAASLLAAAGLTESAQGLQSGGAHKRHSTGARTGPEGKLAQQALRTNFNYFFPFKQRPDGDICSWTETANSDWMEGIPRFMTFLHERFPATRTHEVWGSHERVFKQVRTMFANAQRKARLAGGFIQSPAVAAQAIQLRAEGADNSRQDSPQVSELKEQDEADTVAGHGHEQPEEPFRQASGSQAPLAVPLPAQGPTIIGEAMRHAPPEHDGSTTSSEQGRKRRHEDAIGPGNWPAPLPRQKPAPLQVQESTVQIVS